MSDSTTIARPYAKAVFEHALAKKDLAAWSAHLTTLAQAILLPETAQFIENPDSTEEQHIQLLTSLIKADGHQEQVANLIALLADNQRLMLLPDICALFEAHRAEQEKTIEVDVLSFSELSKNQEERLMETLSQRLQRKVLLKISLDPSLLGGLIIRAGDLVIDGSVRGKLNRLGTGLAA